MLSEQLVPFEINNRWIYDLRYINLGGEIDSVSDSAVYTVVSKLTGLYSDYYAVHIQTVFPLLQEFDYQKNETDGLWTLHPVTFEAELFLPYPTEVNETHNWRDNEIKTLSLDTLLYEANDSFHCIHYYLSNGDSLSSQVSVHTDFYYAVNIGLVKQVGRVFQNNVVQNGSQRVLLGYQLGQSK